MGKTHRQAWEDKKPNRLFAMVRHPTFDVMVKEHQRLIFAGDKWLRRILDPYQKHNWTAGYFNSYMLDAFNAALHYWKPDCGYRLSTFVYKIAKQHVHKEFLQYESENWHGRIDRHNILPPEEHQTQVNYAYHELEFVLYRCPEPDNDWAEEVLSYFPTREEAWEFLTENLKKREKNILQRRFYHGHTLEEIALDEKITRERVRQIQAAALRKMRRRVYEAEDLQNFRREMGISSLEINEVELKQIKSGLFNRRLKGGIES